MTELSGNQNHLPNIRAGAGRMNAPIVPEVA